MKLHKLRLLTENFRRSSTCNICVISWWNNLNRKIELASGKGSIHSNPVIVFQEITIESVSMDVEISVPNSGRISLPKCDHETSIASKINPNRNPPILYGLNPPTKSELKLQHGIFSLSLWNHLQSINDCSQIYPWFVGWITQLFKVLDLKQTLLAYLQPILNPFINYGTIIEMFAHSEQLSKQANMRYTHITFDVGKQTRHIICSGINQRDGQKS